MRKLPKLLDRRLNRNSRCHTLCRVGRIGRSRHQVNDSVFLVLSQGLAKSFETRDWIVFQPTLVDYSIPTHKPLAPKGASLFSILVQSKTFTVYHATSHYGISSHLTVDNTPKLQRMTSTANRPGRHENTHFPAGCLRLLLPLLEEPPGFHKLSQVQDLPECDQRHKTSL